MRTIRVVLPCWGLLACAAPCEALSLGGRPLVAAPLEADLRAEREQALDGGAWPAFGYLAAEAELAGSVTRR